MRTPAALIVRLAGVVLAVAATALLLAHCGEPSPSQVLRERYQLTDAEAEAWNRLYVVEAEVAATALWGLIGRGEFDSAMLVVERYGDERMESGFRNRIERVWAPVVNWPAAGFLNEPQIGLGDGQTVGFSTWGELLSGGFQRAVLCDDSITVFFVFKGYWQAESMPVYAAAACGDFGTESPQWRPFAHVVFSADASEETVKSEGQAYFSRNLEEFLAYLKTRTFGTFGI
jgi:hypothetical protein